MWAYRWKITKEYATFTNAGITIDRSTGDEGIVSSKVFAFSKGEVRRWIYGALAGFVFGILFGFLIGDILVIPRLAPALSADSSVLIFTFALIGAAFAGSMTAMVSAALSKQKPDMAEKWGVVATLKAHEMRKAREKMSESGAKRIDEACAA